MNVIYYYNMSSILIFMGYPYLWSLSVKCRGCPQAHKSCIKKDGINQV